jgi:hypothetical protein
MQQATGGAYVQLPEVNLIVSDPPLSDEKINLHRQ